MEGRFLYSTEDGTAELEITGKEGKTLILQVVASNTKWLDVGDIKKVNKDLAKRMDSLKYVKGE